MFDLYICLRLIFQPPYKKKITLLSDDFIQPNGLCFSLDEKKLFVNDSAREHIRSFIVSDDGSLSEGKVWTTVFGEGKGVPDGMKIDSLGNIGHTYIFRSTESESYNTEYEYDKYNNCIQEKMIYHDGSICFTSYVYEYDKEGNWISKKEYIGDVLNSHYVREIIYFN